MSPVNRSCEQNGDLSVTGVPSEDDSSSTDLKKGTQKNRPQDTRLRQQKLSAWQPILTATSVIPTIFVIGIVFVPIGVALFLASASVQEIQIDYTKCATPSPSSCRMKFVLDKPFEGNVYFYYGLDNYFQNLRRYMKSRSDSQLIGDLYNVGDCAPYAYLNSSGQRKVIAPCGAAANSMFNDTFTLYRADGMTRVPWTYKGIVWPVDKERKFKNPPGANLKEAFANTVKPPNWGKEVWELDPSDPDNNGFMNADFIVWMRTAALPDFRKLYRILLRNGSYSNGLENGTYILDIRSNYPVTVFGGRKSFIISTTSWAGGKNPFLGIVYMTVGSICIVVGCVFLLIHQKFGTRRSEITETYFSRRHEQ